MELKNKKDAQDYANDILKLKQKYLDEIEEIDIDLRVLKHQWGVSPKKRRRHE